MVVDFFGHIRDPEEILHIFDVSYVQKKVDFFRKFLEVPGPIQALKP